MIEYTDFGYETAREIVTDAKENNKVLRLDRIGATPWVKHTPYTNNRDVIINMWSCISYTFKRMPQETLLSHPTIIDPVEYEDYNVRMFTTEWVIRQVAQSRIAKTVPVEESPFAGGVVGGWDTSKHK